MHIKMNWDQFHLMQELLKMAKIVPGINMGMITKYGEGKVSWYKNEIHFDLKGVKKNGTVK